MILVISYGVVILRHLFNSGTFIGMKTSIGGYVSWIDPTFVETFSAAEDTRYQFHICFQIFVALALLVLEL